MEDLKHTGSSIMGFTILDIKNYELAKSSGELNQVCYWKTIFANSCVIQNLAMVFEVLKSWETQNISIWNIVFFQDLSKLVKGSHKAALIYDGVHLFSRAVESLILETDLNTPQVDCDNKESPYDMGDLLLQQINEVGHIFHFWKWEKCFSYKV